MPKLYMPYVYIPYETLWHNYVSYNEFLYNRGLMYDYLTCLQIHYDDTRATPHISLLGKFTNQFVVFLLFEGEI